MKKLIAFLVDKFLHKNFYNRIYRVDGVLKYCLCECENGRLVWSRKPDLEYSDDVDFKYIYDTSDYNSRIEATYKSVQKELIGKLGEVVKNAKGL